LSPHHRHGRTPVRVPTIDSETPPAKSGDSGDNGAPDASGCRTSPKALRHSREHEHACDPADEGQQCHTTWAVPTVVKDRRSAAVSIRSVGKIAARMLPTTNA
jgi:hypothetical protein